MANNNIQQGLEVIGDFIVDQLRKTLEEQGHRATGQLQDTMKSVVTTSGSGFDITIYGQDYAKNVEKGVPKGVWVSVDALAQWVQDKGIASGEREVKNLAFAIQRTIYDKGTIQFREKKKGFVEVVLDENAKLIFKMVLDLFTKEITLSLTNTIRKEKRTFES